MTLYSVVAEAPDTEMAVPTSDGFLNYTLQVGHDQRLKVISDPDNVLGQHIGNGIWTSAHELVCFLRNNHPYALRDRCVLELGAGLGLVGQVVACLSLSQHLVITVVTGTQLVWKYFVVVLDLGQAQLSLCSRFSCLK